MRFYPFGLRKLREIADRLSFLTEEWHRHQDTDYIRAIDEAKDGDLIALEKWNHHPYQCGARPVTTERMFYSRRHGWTWKYLPDMDAVEGWRAPNPLSALLVSGCDDLDAVKAVTEWKGSGWIRVIRNTSSRLGG